MRGLLVALLLLAAPAMAQPISAKYGPGDCPFNDSACLSKSTGSTTARTHASRGADVVNARDFGAICDGSLHPLSATYGTLAAAQIVYPAAISLTQETDDAAINAAVNAVRTSHTFAGVQAANIIMPQGYCVINYGVNLTNLRGYSVTVNASGTALRGQTGAYAVVDALGSAGLKIRDLEIVGDNTSTPTIGLQIGRTDTAANNTSADNVVENLRTDGQFSLAGYVNLNSETTLQSKIDASNSYNSATAYAAIFDGINHWASTSRFVTQNQPANTAQSFAESLCLDCQFVVSGASAQAALWVANPSRMRFISLYALNVSGPYGATIYSLASANNYGVTMDAHFEGSNLTDAFYLDGPGPAQTVTLNGFKYYDHYPFYTNSVFKASAAIARMNMADEEIAIGQAGTFTKVWDAPSLYFSAGILHLPTNTLFNGLSWQGVEYTAEQSGTVILTMQGNMSFTGSDTFTNNLSLNRHVSMGQAAAPVLSSCGTSPAIVGSDIAGQIVTGGGATACTMTFVNAYNAAPYCTVTGQGAAVTYSTSTTALSITAGAAATINYTCLARNGG